jgi:hypothetical protein
VARLRAPEAELRGVDPLTRARLRMQAGERAEAEAAEATRSAARELHEQRLAEQEMRDRVELAQQGFLGREAEATRLEWEQQRKGKITELRLELDRLERGPARLPGADDVESAARRSWALPDQDDLLLQRSAESTRAWNTDPRLLHQRSLSRRAEAASYRAELSRSAAVRSDGASLVSWSSWPNEYEGVTITLDRDTAEASGLVTAMERAPFGGGPGTRRWA